MNTHQYNKDKLSKGEDIMDSVIETIQLSKKYATSEALSHFDFKVTKGEICAVIGKNGAGKSTLFKLLSNELLMTGGKIELFGHHYKSSNEVKKRIGFLIERPKFYESLTAYQNLKYLAKLRGITHTNRLDEVLKLVGLYEVKKHKVETFSIGMKQRLGIAQAILHHPDCLILDEPTNGLDVEGIANIRHLILKLNKEYGVTILISSHILSELKMVAERFIFIRDGRLIHDITKAELEEKSKKYLLLQVDNVPEAVRLLETYFKAIQYTVLPNQVIQIHNYMEEAHQINKVLVEHHILIKEFRIDQKELETYFLELEEAENNV